MIPIENPFVQQEGYNCYACAPNNPIGLSMSFYVSGDYVVARWQPGEHHAGYDNILHGGIRATLIDEISAWLVFVKLDTMGYTVRLEVDFTSKIYTDQGELTIRALILERTKRSVTIAAEILDQDDNVVTSGKTVYALLPQAVARKKMSFPRREEFLPGESVAE